MSDRIRASTGTVRGRVVAASAPDCDDARVVHKARVVHNAMHDRRPVAVVRCTDTADGRPGCPGREPQRSRTGTADDGAGHERLVTAEAPYDPDSLVRVSQNTTPAEGM